MHDFTGQTAVISGGTGALGGAILCALAGLGANVAVLSRKPALPEPLTQQLVGTPGQVAVFQSDVLDRAALIAAEEAIRARFGPAHLLVNGAGGNRPAATTDGAQRFFDLPEDALRAVFDLNLLGAILPCQIFGRAMAEQQQGVILNVSSMSARRPLSRVVAYSAAQAGLENFTRWLATHMALEYSPGIRVNQNSQHRPSPTRQVEEQGKEEQGQSQGEPGFKMKSRHSILTAEVEMVRMAGLARSVKPPWNYQRPIWARPKDQ